MLTRSGNHQTSRYEIRHIALTSAGAFRRDFRFLTPAVERFTDEMRARNWSENTVAGYRFRLLDLAHRECLVQNFQPNLRCPKPVPSHHALPCFRMP
jgi:hypothetical protein